MVGPPKTDCPRVREKVIWESLYPILGSIRPHGLDQYAAKGEGAQKTRFLDTKGFVAIACSDDASEIRAGLEDCRKAIDITTTPNEKSAQEAYFKLHERRAFRRLLTLE